MQAHTLKILKRILVGGFLVGLIVTIIFGAMLLSIDARIKSHAIYSEQLDERRNIRVLLPANYNDKPAKKYDVIYALDGEWFRFSHMVMLVAEITPGVPPVIVVSIDGQGKRMRDYSPNDAVAFDGRDIAGNANSFLAFIHQELMPFVNKTYRESGTNILSGYSMGGLFTTHAFIQDPTKFDGYLAFSPAFPAAIHTVDRFQATFQNNPELNGYFYINVGLERLGGYKSRIERAEQILQTSAPSDFNYNVSYTPLIHGAVMLPGYIEGLWDFYRANPQ